VPLSKRRNCSPAIVVWYDCGNIIALVAGNGGNFSLFLSFRASRSSYIRVVREDLLKGPLIFQLIRLEELVASFRSSFPFFSSCSILLSLLHIVFPKVHGLRADSLTRALQIFFLLNTHSQDGAKTDLL